MLRDPCCIVLLRDSFTIAPEDESRCSSSSTLSLLSSSFKVRRRFFRALAAHSGSGLIFSNCLRSRRSYSRPARELSFGASRSFRNFRIEATSIASAPSSGSVQAGALPACTLERTGAATSEGAGVGRAFSGSVCADRAGDEARLPLAPASETSFISISART